MYDEANQAKPETLTVPLQTIRDYVQQSGGTASAEIVDLDVPAEDRSPAAQGVTELGVMVDGKPLIAMSDNPNSPQQITQMLSAAAK